MEEKEESYFLGAMILIEKKDHFEVVDGQQRLTTLTILFCVLRDLYLQEDPKIKNIIKSLIDQEYRLKLITQLNYQNQFEDQILIGVKFPKIELSKKDLEKNKFINAALIFKEKLSQLKRSQISGFVSYLLDKVIMISIVCTKQHFAIKLFQVLNNRGLDLENTDLIKSHLYGKLMKIRDRQKFMATWGQIETISKQEHVDEPLENLFTFYEYYLLVKNPKSTLFEELKKTKEFDQDSNKIIIHFKEFVDDFSKIMQVGSSLIHSLKYIPNQVFWKVILTTAKRENFKDFERLCKELIRMYYSYWIAGYTTSKIKQLSFNIIGLLKKKRSLAEIKKTINDKIRDDGVINRITDNLCGEAYGEAWTKPLLTLIEYNQTDDSKITYIEMDRKLHLDHILPDKWAKINYWKRNWDKEKASIWLNKLGNLTLLSGKKNIAASNGSFREKKKIYKGKGLDGTTPFLISQKIRDNKDWREKEVKKRQHWLIKQTKNLLDLKIKKAPL